MCDILCILSTISNRKFIRSHTTSFLPGWHTTWNLSTWYLCIAWMDVLDSSVFHIFSLKSSNSRRNDNVWIHLQMKKEKPKWVENGGNPRCPRCVEYPNWIASVQKSVELDTIAGVWFGVRLYHFLIRYSDLSGFPYDEVREAGFSHRCSSAWLLSVNIL